MASLVRALGKGVKTVAGATAQSAYARVAANMPSPTQGMYGLGLGIGSTIQSTVTNYKKESEDEEKANKRSDETNNLLKAANQSNSQSYKSIASALTSMNRILDDIRRVNVAQLAIANRQFNTKNVNARSSYADVEKLIESQSRPSGSEGPRQVSNSSSASNSGIGGLLSGLMSNKYVQGAALGAIALTVIKNWDSIKDGTAEFLRAAGYDPETVRSDIKQFVKSTGEQLGNLAVDTVTGALTTIGSLINTQLKAKGKEIEAAFNKGKERGGLTGGIHEVNKYVAPTVTSMTAASVAWKYGGPAKIIASPLAAFYGSEFGQDHPDLAMGVIAGGATMWGGYQVNKGYKNVKGWFGGKSTPTTGPSTSIPSETNVSKGTTKPLTVQERLARRQYANRVIKTPQGTNAISSMLRACKEKGTKFLVKLLARLGPRVTPLLAPLVAQVGIPGWGEIASVVIAIIGIGFAIEEIINVIADWEMEDYDTVMNSTKPGAMRDLTADELAAKQIVESTGGQFSDPRYESKVEQPVEAWRSNMLADRLSGIDTSGIKLPPSNVSQAAPLSFSMDPGTQFNMDEYINRVGMSESGNKYYEGTKEQGQTASGRFGIIKGTFETLSKNAPMGSKLRSMTWEEFKKSPEMQDYAMKMLSEYHYKELSKKLGRPPTEEEMYMAHFLGIGGATALITNVNSDAPIREILVAGGYGKGKNPSPEDVVRYNKNLFKNVNTAGDLYASVSRFYHRNGAGGFNSPTSDSMTASAPSSPGSMFSPDQMASMGLSEQDTAALGSLQAQISESQGLVGQIMSVFAGGGGGNQQAARSETPQTIIANPTSATEKDKLVGTLYPNFNVRPA